MENLVDKLYTVGILTLLVGVIALMGWTMVQFAENVPIAVDNIVKMHMERHF